MSAALYRIEEAESLAARCHKLYQTGLPPGDSTGWPSLDPHFTVAPAQWTLVTGRPHSGKSEWLDALAVNLAESADWDFAVYSPENHPTELHLAKLAEKRARKPFGRGPTERMTEDELDAATRWVCEHFFWLKPEYASYDHLLTAALTGRQPGRKLGVILDPWNTLEHQRPKDLSETEYISQALTFVTNWCRAQRLHVFIVAHPAKLYPDKDGNKRVPTPYDVAGSAHWYNKADNIICVDRDQLEGGQDVDIHIQKVRFKHIGRVGLVSLKWDKVVGRYFEAPWAAKGELYADPERKA